MYIYRCLTFIILIALTPIAGADPVAFWNLTQAQPSKHSLEFKSDSTLIWTDELEPGVVTQHQFRVIDVYPTRKQLQNEFKKIFGKNLESGINFVVEDEGGRQSFYVLTDKSGQMHLIQQGDTLDTLTSFAYVGVTIDSACQQILTAPMISTAIH